jgi:hypothetical protein
MNQRIHIVLGDGVTVQDIERALVHTGLTICSTVAPHVYTIEHAKQRLPLAAYDHLLSAFHRRQAD